MTPTPKSKPQQECSLTCGVLPPYEVVAAIPRRTRQQLKKYCFSDLPPELWEEFGFYATEDEIAEYRATTYSDEEWAEFLLREIGVDVR